MVAQPAMSGWSPPAWNAPTDSELVALRWLSREFGDEFGSGKLAVLYEQRYRCLHPDHDVPVTTSRRVSWARTSGREMGRMCRKGLLRLVSVDGRTSSSFTDGRRTYGLTDEAREAIK